MASVVKAQAPSGRALPPVVALKFLHRELLDNDDAVDAFRHEAVMGLRCVHPNLCRTFAYEVVQARPAIVLEFLQGSSLSHLGPELRAYRAEKDTPLVVAQIVADLCKALQAIHSCRDEYGESILAVHRDVTPQNVVLTDEGECKLIDLGVAFSSARELKTMSGLVKGKMSYLAPEYLLGRPWDRRIDIWSAGVVLWELLTGARLFQGNSTAEKVSAVTRVVVPAPSSLRPHLPPELDPIVLKALQRDPQRRYQSAEAMAADLLRFVQNNSDGVDLRHWLRSLHHHTESGVMPTVQRISDSAHSKNTDTPTIRPMRAPK